MTQLAEGDIIYYQVKMRNQSVELTAYFRNN